ncbi:acriflavin resistance protein [Planctobacterium marinum]|uniref:Acriflavin resistance protein n=2 Tax=Planctobacterium marinum TaxID=1631968 RepID=A0AA48I6M2_9ALTE|nr:acriflavin resistance protein [Planctobacterium marinum]
MMNKAQENKFEAMGASLANFALRRPVTVCMFFASMLLLGLISSRLLPLEKFPGIDIPEIYINIPYRDASPAEVEKMITRPVEEALATMSGIQRLRSSSRENGAEIGIEFKWDENINAKSIEAREKIDAIRHLLPDDVERILVYQFNTNDLPIFQLRVSSERDLSNAYDLLERNLKQPIERVEGVSRVELYGVLKKEIAIRVDQERMAALHVNVVDLVNALQAANFSMSAGHIYENEEKISVTPQGEYRSMQEIEELYIARGIQLKDIADVHYETPRRSEGRHLDQTYAVGFNIFRESGSNLVEVSERVWKVIDDANENPAFNGINLLIFDDEAESVTSSLSDLVDAGLLGALLSVLVLYAFLRRFTTTLIVVLSVPFSLCITLGFMFFFGYSINILSLMGLMLAVGMLVDNAVVVTESIEQEKAHTKNMVAATKAGVSKVSLAVIAGTATTAIVFLPNIIGKKVSLTIFLEHVAISICISLFASLLIAQTLIPLLATKIKHKPRAQDSKPNRLKQRYERMLKWTLSHQGWSAIIGVLMVVSTVFVAQMVPDNEQGMDNRNRLWLNYNINGNYTLDEVEKTVTRLENFLYDNQEKFFIKSIYSYYTPGFAVSGITLQDELPIKKKEIQEMIREALPKFARAEPSFRWSDGGGGGVRLTLLGPSSESLLRIADQVVPVLANIDGLADVKTEIDDNQRELQIHVDRQKAYRFGLNSQDISNIVATALRGNNLRTFRHGNNGEVDIRLMFDEALQHSIEELKSLPVAREGNKTVTLDMVADLKITSRLSQINRYYRQTAIAIGANMEEGMTLDVAREKIEKIMGNLELPTGYSWSLDGSFRQQREDEAIMQTNMLLAIAMIYIVMAALFESLLLPTAVITSLLFSFTGVFWTFAITGTPMSIMGMIGMLILMGIVVNNGIVLVDRINQLVNEGHKVHDAIMEGCLTRVRPVLMTVATTVLGLLPLALGDTNVGGDGPPYAPMAIAIIGGLIFSTVTSLFLVPLAYLLLLKLRRKTRNMINDSKLLVSKIIKEA